MKIQLAIKPLSEVKKEPVVLPIFEDDKSDYGVEAVKNFLKDNSKFGKRNDTQLLYSGEQKFLLVGAGKKGQFDYLALQNWAGTAAKYFLQRSEEIVIVLPKEISLNLEKVSEAVAIGLEIAAHNIATEYQSEKDSTKLKSAQVLVERNDRSYSEGLRKGLVLAESINLVRRLGDLPSNEMTPTYFVNVAKKIAKEQKLKITVINELKAKKMGMGAFTGVARGSDEPSYMIALEYVGDLRSKERWGLVGKGVTFDSGGISIKPSSSMNEMKYDMCGAAAVLGTLQAVAKLKLKKNVVGVMAVTENMPGGKALKPGDIVKTYSGKTAEVIDTDAEGRLILSDAVSFAQKDMKVTKLIDLATLTGAIIVALGDDITGVFGNDRDFAKTLIDNGRLVGEKYWEMPMDEEFEEMIKSDFADIANLGHGGSSSRAAGSITGAKFIEAMINEGLPWLHLDIAGTAWDMKSRPYRGIGATGVGVKTLVEVISNSGK